MSNYGIQERAKPRLQVKRGWDPTNPTKFSTRAPVKTGVTILSGQVISLANVGGELVWELGCATGRIPHFAIQDSEDFDVRGSGVLTALSALDSFELHTPYFKASPSTAYGLDVPLTYDGTTGDVTTTELESGAPIIGYVHNAVGPVDHRETMSAITPDDDGKVLLLPFRTSWRENTADA